MNYSKSWYEGKFAWTSRSITKKFPDINSPSQLTLLGNRTLTGDTRLKNSKIVNDKMSNKKIRMHLYCSPKSFPQLILYYKRLCQVSKSPLNLEKEPLKAPFRHLCLTLSLESSQQVRRIKIWFPLSHLR